MATNEEIVARAQQLYVSYYGRPADPEGLAFWTQYFTDNTNVDEAVAAFGASAEYEAIAAAAGGDTAALINQLYQFMFNRDADEDGLAFYTMQLDNGEATLASIALDIANGAVAGSEDRNILDNKIEVANGFTADVESDAVRYAADDIAGARTVLTIVGASAESVTAGTDAVAAFILALPAIAPGGEFTLDEDTPTATYAGATSAVTVTLDGDNDEADFDVTLSAFDDTVILEEFKSAKIVGGAGTDTLDTSEHSGAATVNLLAGIFNVDGFRGSISGVENVIGTDEDDTITGSDEDNSFWSGEGDDTVRGGIGDDTFFYEDESELGSGTIDGQTGDDTVTFTADAVDLSALDIANLAVENLVLSNMDGKDDVLLTLATAGTTTVEGTVINKVDIADFRTISGTAGTVDVITSAGNNDLSKTRFESIESVRSTGATAIFTIGADTAGLALAGGSAKDAILAFSSTAAATFDLTTLTLSNFDVLRGQDNKLETVIVNQAILDMLLANSGGAGANALGNLGDDTLQLVDNVDFAGWTPANLAMKTLDFGTADTVLFDDFAATGFDTVTGGAGTSLIIQPGDDAQDLSGVKIVDVATLLFDITTGNEGLDVTMSEDTLSGVSLITGEIDLIAKLSSGAKASEGVDLTGVTIADGQNLRSATATDRIIIGQSGIDGFKSFGGGAGTFLTLVMAENSLDLSDANIEMNTALSVTGTAGDDTVTNALTKNGGSFNLGAGDDSFTGLAIGLSGTTGAGGNAGAALNMGGGSNTVNGAVLGDLILRDPTAGANDGDNLVIGRVDSTVTGAGARVVGGTAVDTLVGAFVGNQKLRGGDDSITGLAASGSTVTGGADLGSGDDSYTSFGQTFNYIIAGGGRVVAGSTVDGGTGEDTFVTRIRTDVLTGGEGSDSFTVVASVFGDLVTGGTANGQPSRTDYAGLVTLRDYDLNTDDELYIDILKTYTTGTKATNDGRALTGSVSVKTALNEAVTDNGGLRMLNARGDLVNIAPGEAIGSTVALPVFANTAAVLAYLADGDDGLGTANDNIPVSLANTTFVIFALTKAVDADADNVAKLVAYKITADDDAQAAVVAGEISQVDMINFAASDGIGGSDIILI